MAKRDLDLEISQLVDELPRRTHARLDRSVIVDPTGSAATEFMDGFRFVLRASGLKYRGLPEMGKDPGQTAWIRDKVDKAVKSAQATRRPFAFMAGARGASETLLGFIDELHRKGRQQGLTPSQIATLEAEATGASGPSAQAIFDTDG